MFLVATTHVQSVTLCLSHLPDSFHVWCSYVLDTNAQGCKVLLVNKDRGAPNITSNVRRVLPAGVFAHLQVPDRNLSRYEEVVAFDWRADGSIGNFPVRKRKECYLG